MNLTFRILNNIRSNMLFIASSDEVDNCLISFCGTMGWFLVTLRQNENRSSSQVSKVAVCAIQIQSLNEASKELLFFLIEVKSHTDLQSVTLNFILQWVSSLKTSMLCFLSFRGPLSYLSSFALSFHLFTMKASTICCTHAHKHLLNNSSSGIKTSEE